MDAVTDAAVQRCLREAVESDASLLTIAHRLATVADCERILSIGRAKAEQKVHRVPLEDMGLCNSDPLGWSVGRRHKTRTCPQLCMMCVNRCEFW